MLAEGPTPRVIIGSHFGKLRCLEAETGRELWQVECMYGEVGPSPAYADGIVYAANQAEKAANINLIDVRAVGVTGSARQLAAVVVGADVVKNEITAHAVATAHYVPGVRTIIEIGGQDSKYIYIANTYPLDFDMNKVCAAGTGSFLHELANKFDVNIVGEFEEIALAAPAPVRLAQRCTVFMESDLVSYHQRGVPTENLIAGLCYAIVHNYLNRVVGKRKIGRRLMFLGGPSLNKGVVAAFENILDQAILVAYFAVILLVGWRLRRRMALVMQDPFLFSGSIRDNILPQRATVSDETLRTILADANCLDFVMRLPQGLDTPLNEGGASLSSGERQLLSIARAFARQPDIIILDEATSYIDSETENRIQEALQRLTTGRTTFLVAHRLSTVKQADQILVLHHGNIIESGSHADLMARQAFYYRLQHLQG